jgi:PIN domain nuclease of toxin-antitoxin system
MNILPVTRTFLWMNFRVSELSRHAVELLPTRQHDMYLGPVSGWEVSLKYSPGRLRMSEPPSVLVPRFRELGGIRSLPLSEDDALHERKLPQLHSDPFDRMLIPEALAHGMTIRRTNRALSAARAVVTPC